MAPTFSPKASVSLSPAPNDALRISEPIGCVRSRVVIQAGRVGRSARLREQPLLESKSAEQAFDEGELSDLMKRDERAGVGYDSSHAVTAVFPRSHSSALMSMLGIPSCDAWRIKSSRDIPSNSPALPLETAPRR